MVIYKEGEEGRGKKAHRSGPENRAASALEEREKQRFEGASTAEERTTRCIIFLI